MKVPVGFQSLITKEAKIERGAFTMQLFMLWNPNSEQAIKEV